MDFTDQATLIVDLIRSRNWENGGVFAINRADAVDLVEQALKTAYAQGSCAGTAETGASMLRAFDEVVGGPQTEAVKRLIKVGA